MEIAQLKSLRLKSWNQDGESRLANPSEAKAFIDRLGLVTHYSASSEVPNLFNGHMSDPNAKVDSGWDSPSGHVYEWRWGLGRPGAAFYGALVAKKPTWISWKLLSLVLGFTMDRRTPEALYADGLMSNDAIRIARAFDGTDGVLSTKELRLRAGFPTGMEQRAAYLKGVEELDSRMFLAKVFAAEGEGDDMCHALVSIKYADQVSAALRLNAVDALESFLTEYLAQSVYIDPKIFAKHLRLDHVVVAEAVNRLVAKGIVTQTDSFVAFSG